MPGTWKGSLISETIYPTRRPIPLVGFPSVRLVTRFWDLWLRDT